MSEITRRRFLMAGIGVGGGLVLSRSAPARADELITTSSMIDPTTIPKYVTALVIPPAMPPAPSSPLVRSGGKNFTFYEIGVRQFEQQILPPSSDRWDFPPDGITCPDAGNPQCLGFPETTVWGYGSIHDPATFNYPSFTIEATWRKPVAVRWVNQLVDENGNFLPHLLTVDPTLHWANPPGGDAGRDSAPTFPTTPPPYTKAVPIVTHLHGGSGTAQESDGYPEAWFLPDAKNIPEGFATEGTFYEPFKSTALLGDLWTKGSAVFAYMNDQRPATLWYHDHTLGMTRLNVYAGPAGFYILRGGPEDAKDHELPGPAPQLGDLPGTRYFEIPLAIQDRSFNTDGSLFYPTSRTQFGDFSGPFIPDSPVPPYWNPEFFGNTMVVNGRTWPRLDVEPRRYRFRMLDGCDARFLILQFRDEDTGELIDFTLIGTDGGFLPEPQRVTSLLLTPAQRMDVIVDFTDRAGHTITMENVGPDEAFDGLGGPITPADPNTTGQVMRFVVALPLSSKDKSKPSDKLKLPKFTPLGPAANVRSVSLVEQEFEGAPAAVLLGTVAAGAPVPLRWMDDPTETPRVGVTEFWDIYNFTVDSHPIHIHEIEFQLVSRRTLAGDPVNVRLPNETGFIDTVAAFPGQITRVKVLFKTPGRFVWHCHIIEHEDNEMMRPLQILP